MYIHPLFLVVLIIVLLWICADNGRHVCRWRHQSIRLLSLPQQPMIRCVSLQEVSCISAPCLFFSLGLSGYVSLLPANKKEVCYGCIT